MQRRATTPVALRSANMWARHMKRRDIRTIARRRKRAAPGGGMRRGSFPRPDFRPRSSHRASGIVRDEGDQMPSRHRTSTLMRAPRRSPPTVNGRSRHPRAAPTRTKLLAFDRWYFPSDSQPGPRRCHGRASTIEQVHFKLRPVRPPWRY